MFALLVMLIAIYHHAYDALVLVPVLLTAGWRLDEFWQSWTNGQRWAWCALVAIPLANYAATNSAISAWGISGPAWTAVTCLNGASLLAATVWLAIVLLVYQDKWDTDGTEDTESRVPEQRVDRI